MVLSQDDVIQILKLMDESKFNELHLEMDNLKIIVNKRADPTRIENQKSASVESSDALSATEKTIKTAEKNPVSSNFVQTTPAPQTVRMDEEQAEEEGLIPIKSPILGIFYTAEKPGAPPFVEIGSVVDEKTTVCIIEVMKLFSTITAGIQGRIKRICAQDGQMIEYGQVLFLVEADTG